MEDNNTHNNNKRKRGERSREVTFTRHRPLEYDLSLILGRPITVAQLPRNKPGQEEQLVFRFDGVGEAADQGWILVWAFSFTSKEEDYLSVSKPQRAFFTRNAKGIVTVRVPVDLDQAGGHKKLTIYLFDFNGSMRQTHPLYLFREPTHRTKDKDLGVHKSAIEEWKKIVEDKPYLFDAIAWWQTQSEETKNQLTKEDTPQVIMIQPFGASPSQTGKKPKGKPTRITLAPPVPPQSQQSLVQLNTVTIQQQQAFQTPTTPPTTPKTTSTKPRPQKRTKVSDYDATNEESEEVDTVPSWSTPQYQQMDVGFVGQQQNDTTNPLLLPTQPFYQPSETTTAPGVVPMNASSFDYSSFFASVTSSPSVWQNLSGYSDHEILPATPTTLTTPATPESPKTTPELVFMPKGHEACAEKQPTFKDPVAAAYFQGGEMPTFALEGRLPDEASIPLDWLDQDKSNGNYVLFSDLEEFLNSSTN